MVQVLVLGLVLEMQVRVRGFSRLKGRLRLGTDRKCMWKATQET